MRVCKFIYIYLFIIITYANAYTVYAFAREQWFQFQKSTMWRMYARTSLNKHSLAGLPCLQYAFGRIALDNGSFVAQIPKI